MQIEADKVVSFHYRMREAGAESEPLEDSYGGNPVLYLHGRRGIFPALEEALEGKQAGDSLSVTLTPEQAYGPRREAPPQRVPVKHLLTKGKLRPGSIVDINTEHGPQKATVVKVGKFNVDVDTNHPLAGKALTFEVEVIDVREASAEELSHGHAHGAGGHQH